MSHITDIVLLTLGEDEVVGSISEWIGQRLGMQSPLKLVNDDAGGTRRMQSQVWAGSYNNFADNIGDLCSFVQGCSWEWPELVMLLIKDEHDERWWVMRVDGRGSQ